MNDYILFDLDGTLTDPKVGITTCVQYALASFGIEESDPNKLTPFIGPPLKDSFMEFYDFDEEKAETAVEKYRERFKDTGIFENEIYEGIPELIRKLKGNKKKLAVASSKPTVFVERILEHFDIRRYFDVVVGSELDGRRTDKAEVVAEALRQLYGEDAEDIEKKKQNTLMVGDRKFDVKGAKDEGVVSVAVTYGYGPMDELKIAKPDYIVRSVAELEKLLLRGTEKTAAEPPLSKALYVLVPVLIYYFVREIGANIGYFILNYMAVNLPASAVSAMIYFNEMGEPEGITGNGVALMSGLAFLTAGIVTWKFFAKEELGKAKEALTLRHALLKTPLAYACMAVGTLGIALGLNFLYDLLRITYNSASYQQTSEMQYAAAIPVGLLLNGLLVPVAEELMFRGVLYNRMKKYMTYLPAIALSALCFGIYHQNLVQGSYAFFMGCIIAYFYECFGRFHVPVIAHAISNISAYVLTVWTMRTDFVPQWWQCILLLAIGVGGFAVCWQMRNPKMESGDSEPKQ
ncbi:MAG: HAD hydrolase-like protein [Lachnospiraceae bacterium]|nr:HAD hydrolase-like protein [Lachnospiraceae bacterium]